MMKTAAWRSLSKKRRGLDRELSTLKQNLSRREYVGAAGRDVVIDSHPKRLPVAKPATHGRSCVSIVDHEFIRIR